MNLSIRLQRRYYAGFKNLKLFMVLIIGIITCLATDCMGQRASFSSEYETQGFLIASDVLPPELTMGKNYSIMGAIDSTADTATLGFTYKFNITSFQSYNKSPQESI